jgi:hypothetical protein
MGMSLGIPTPDDIRARIEGYGFDAQASLSLPSGAFTSGGVNVSGVSTKGIRPYMMVTGTNIAQGTRVASILTPSDPGLSNGTIVLDTPTTGPGPQALTVWYYSVKSDEWLIQCRDSTVIPWVNRVTKQNFQGIQTVTEFYDGTGEAVLMLRRRPVVSLLSISYTNVNSNLYYLTPSAILLMQAEGILKAKSNFNDSSYIPIFYRGTRNIQVIYQYGYATIPADVNQAICALVAEQALASAASKTGGGDLSGEGYSRSFGKSGKYTHERRRLTREAMADLRGYMTGAMG